MNPPPASTSLLFTVYFLFVMIASGRVTSCPLQCQCNSQYYVYCQDADLDDGQLIDVIARVPTSAILLDLSGNQISRLVGGLFSRLPKLEYLYLGSNSLEEVGDHVFSNLTLLRQLDFQDNQIRSVGINAFKTLSKLEELHLGTNSLTSLPAGVFSELEKLKKLRLCKNSISHLKALTFSGLNSLELLNLSNNRLKRLNSMTFTGLSSLKKLNLNRNELSTFHTNAFDDLTNLLELDLSHNDISDLAFLYGNPFFPTIELLFLSHNIVNNIPEESISCNRNLKTLDLSSNRIHSIASASFKGLRLDYLKLEKNTLTEVSRETFQDVTHISHLNLSSNSIRDIKTGAFDSFRETVLVLDLKFNALSYIHPGMFRRMLEIRSLYLGHNHISKLDPGSFSDMVRLQDLDLSRNRLTTLSHSTISGPENLRNLFLANTPLEELTGFILDESDDRIFIEANSTVRHVSKTQAVLTWPYRQGSQLYWKVAVTCLVPSGCPSPSYPSILRAYKQSLTLSRLTSGHVYFACVNPIFLSPEVTLTQCVNVQTDATQSDAPSSTPTLEEQRENNDKNGCGSFGPLLSPLTHKATCLLLSVIVLLLFWSKQL